MKNYYKISEISKLYDIGNDSLRYYEKIDILHPRRDENGYRMYGLADISTLNVIKELKNIGYSMKDIKVLLKNRSVDSTITLLDKQNYAIDEKIKQLTKMKLDLKNRKAGILKSLDFSNFGEITIKEENLRKCLMLNEGVVREEEVDLLIRKIQDKNSSKIFLLGNTMIGAVVESNLEDILELQKNPAFESPLDISSKYASVFNIVEEKEEFDFVIEKGLFISVIYKGNYNQTYYYICEMLKFASEFNLTPTGEVYELYMIDVHETSIIEEFITEIQMRITA